MTPSGPAASGSSSAARIDLPPHRRDDHLIGLVLGRTRLFDETSGQTAAACLSARPARPGDVRIAKAANTALDEALLEKPHVACSSPHIARVRDAVFSTPREAAAVSPILADAALLYSRVVQSARMVVAVSPDAGFPVAKLVQLSLGQVGKTSALAQSGAVLSVAPDIGEVSPAQLGDLEDADTVEHGIRGILHCASIRVALAR